MLATLRILAVTLPALALPLNGHPAQAGRAESGLAQSTPTHKHHRIHHRGKQPRQHAEIPATESRPPTKAIPSPEDDPSAPATDPDDDEEVSPGDSPVSCDGCALAGFSLAGSLWGLFGVRRRDRKASPSVRGAAAR